MKTTMMTGSAAVETAAGARLKLAAVGPSGSRRTLDGAWWPRTRNLAAELPGLIQELDRRGVQVTRVTYSPTFWDPAPRRICVAARVVRLGSFTTMDAHLLGLTSGTRERHLELLVVPPDVGDDLAATAMDRAATAGNRTTATDLLGRDAAGDQVALPLPRPPLAAEAQMDGDTATWDTEGGHAHR